MYKEKHILNQHTAGHKLSRYIDVYELNTVNCSADKTTGYKGDTITITGTPAWNQKTSSYSVTGATLTGNQFDFTGSDVTAQANYETAKSITTQSCSANKVSGFSGDNVTVTGTPAWNQKLSGYGITGATLTGNNFKIANSNVTVQGKYETAKNVTLQTDGHGNIAANKTSGFIGDTVTLSNTPAAHYTFSAYSLTGANLTGNNFNFIGNDVTAKALFKLMSYNNVVLTSDYGTITATPNTAVSGETVVLTNTPNADCHFVNYEVTGATLTGDRYTMPTSNVSARGVFARNVHNVTLQTNGYGTLTSNKTTGYSGDVVSMTATPNTDYQLTRYDITGSTVTSNSFSFRTTDVTAKAIFSEVPVVSSYCFNYPTTYAQRHIGSLPFSTRDWPEYGNCVIANSAKYVDVKFTIDYETPKQAGTLLISGNNVWKAASPTNYAPLRCGGTITTVIPDVRPSIWEFTAFGETYSAIRGYTGHGYAVSLNILGTHTYQYIYDRTSNVCSAYFDKEFMCSGPISTFTALPLTLGVSAITGNANNLDLTFSAISVTQFNKAAAAYQFLLA